MYPPCEIWSRTAHRHSPKWSEGKITMPATILRMTARRQLGGGAASVNACPASLQSKLATDRLKGTTIVSEVLMQFRLGILALVFLGACGGGDDGNITNPPAAQSFTLTITGTGTGAGHVVSGPGTTPVIDCQLSPNGVSNGLCSGTYSEGASVSLTVTPASGST